MSNKDETTKALTEMHAKGEEAVDNTVTLSTGVVLKVKGIPPAVYLRVANIHPMPKPRMYQDKHDPEVFYSNPDDDNYIKEVDAWESKNRELLLNTMILWGTELVSVPKKFPGPDTNEWLDKYEVLGINTKLENKSWRYLEWVSSTACADGKDFDLIFKVVRRLTGVPEDDVKAAEGFSGSN